MIWCMLDHPGSTVFVVAAVSKAAVFGPVVVVVEVAVVVECL